MVSKLSMSRVRNKNENGLTIRIQGLDQYHSVVELYTQVNGCWAQFLDFSFKMKVLY